MATPTTPRRKKRRESPFLIHYWRPLTLLVVLAAAASIFWIVRKPRGPVIHHLNGYITDLTTLRTEYQHFQGKAMKSDVQQEFEQAADRVGAADYEGAVVILQALVKTAALPVVFNDLGILYLQLNDRARAINAFRDALARDYDYTPVRLNLDRMRDAGSGIADPVTAEVEPNNSIPYANVISIDRPVDAEISTSADQDFFRVTTPPAPRDLVEVSITNRSKTLAPHLRVYDDEGNILPEYRQQRSAGGSFSFVMAPPPNTTYCLSIMGDETSTGAYTVLVKALKRFDSYEPNDDIYTVRTIALGQQIDANIMDADDTDFYAFESPRSGVVSIDIENRSPVLVPALTTFTPDRRTSGFGPDVELPGASLHHTITVQEGQTYFIQVWSQAKTSGDYSLKIQ